MKSLKTKPRPEPHGDTGHQNPLTASRTSAAACENTAGQSAGRGECLCPLQPVWQRPLQ